MKIFISYRRKDSAREVGRIRDRLKEEFGEQSVFRDLVDIPAGVDFRTVLERETNGCDVMLVVIGPLWAGITDVHGNKRLFNPGDFTRIEVETGLKRLEEGTVRVFPVLVMNAVMPSAAEIPESLTQLTNQNAIEIHDDPYFDFDIGRLIRDIKNSEVYIPPVENLVHFEPETIYIPDGPFLMGSLPEEKGSGYGEQQHEVTLPAFRIGKFPVTNAQYEAFIRDTRRQVSPVMGWDGQAVPPGCENQPVAGVTWYEALDYCKWISKETGRRYCLPNDAQWEKACRGGNNFLYPWGNKLDPARSNHDCAAMADVNAYPAQNEFGLHDLVGNMRQWTVTLWGEKRNQPDGRYASPWKDDHRNNINANRQIRRVVRGSSYKEASTAMRCSFRSGELPEEPGFPGMRHGFRVVMQL